MKTNTQQQVTKFSAATQVRLTGKFVKCLFSRVEKSPRQFFAHLVKIPAKLTGDIGVIRWRLFDGQIHPRLSWMTFSHAARITSDE
jgi:hypothetical protein